MKSDTMRPRISILEISGDETKKNHLNIHSALPKVTVIIPTMNEEGSIGEVLDQIPKTLTNVEILVIDTNSRDRTVEIAKSKGAVVINEPRRGYGRAYKTGFVNAHGDVIVTLDGDTTYPAEEIPALIQMLLDDDLDFITCDRLSRIKSGAMNFQHRIGNWILTFTANLLFNIRLSDSQSGMWVFRKRILDGISLKANGMQLSEEIKIETFSRGFKAREVSVNYRARKGEVKLNTWKDGYRNLIFIFLKKLSAL